MAQGIKKIGFWLVAATVAAFLAACGGGSSGAPAGAAPPAGSNASSAPVPDAARAAVASIGFAGGSVTATAANGVSYTLAVPAGALAAPVEIRLTPITSMGSAPLSKGLIGAVQMEPSGLKFRLPATLKIGATPVLAAGQTLVGFITANDGTNMRLALPTVRNGGIEVTVAHFSNAGVAGATPEEVTAVPLDPVQDPGEVEFWIREIYLGDRSPTTVGENFLSWFNGVVSPRLTAASGSDDSTLDALAAYENWINSIETTTEVLNFSSENKAQMLAFLAAQIDQAKGIVSAILRAKLQADLATCQASPRIDLVEFASLMQQIAARFGLDKPEQGLDRAAFLRLVNDCLRPVMSPITLPTPQPIGTPKSLDARAQVVFNGIAAPQGAPFEFTVTPTGATVAKAVGFSDAAGAYTTVFTPSADTVSFSVRACLVLNDANSTSGSDVCVTEVVSTAPPGTNIFAGNVSVIHTFTNGQSSVNAFVRVRVNADGGTGEVIEVRGTESHSFSSEIFCVRADASTFTTAGSDVGSGTVTIATYGEGGALQRGALALLGLASKTVVFDNDLGDMCNIVTRTITRGVGNEEQFTVLREPVLVFEGGRLVSIDYSQTSNQVGSARTVAGVLVPEK